MVSMRAWHKTGRPDKGKDGRNKPHWRMYVRIAKRKVDLLEFGKSEEEGDEGVK